MSRQKDRAQNGTTSRFPKSAFTYDTEKNVYVCPSGEALPKSASGTHNGRPYTVYSRRSACTKCHLREQCKSGKGPKRIHRYEGEDALERVKARMVAWPRAMAARQQIVEHPFGSIKHWMGHRDFLTRRLPNVRAEFSLTALAYNMRRAINILGVEALEKAARA